MPIPSKLDSYTVQLDQWFGVERITAPTARKRLRKLKCEISEQALCAWRKRRREKLESDEILADIVSGARECQQLKKEFNKIPVPDLQTLIKLHRILLYELSKKGKKNPNLLKTASSMFAAQMNYERLKLMREKIDQFDEALKLAREKFQFSAAKACDQKFPEIKAISTNNSLNDDEKIDQIRIALFGSAPN